MFGSAEAADEDGFDTVPDFYAVIPVPELPQPFEGLHTHSDYRIVHASQQPPGNARAAGKS